MVFQWFIKTTHGKSVVIFRNLELISFMPISNTWAGDSQQDKDLRFSSGF